MSFGGTDWDISPVDMNVGTVTSDMCAGAIFDVGAIDGGNLSDTWIVGDTFLKNVYSVFRAEPPAVGFAQLASGLSSSSGTFDSNPVQPGSIPAPTTAGGSIWTGGSDGAGESDGAAFANNIAGLLTLLVTVSTCFILFL
ncbi:hypothetical protein AZE42_05212 [Rhizopogon vesiculosus]|uniref:Peptidase A1 domain-containing protein n=1 Tax=Rhizopogon vesiculosus TaxID=180088 RepID=A0A1J8PXL7_9AGAM|nr:hypothetical protein AZE42_05212 [Rhizopogon vesiculosus]